MVLSNQVSFTQITYSSTANEIRFSIEANFDLWEEKMSHQTIFLFVVPRGFARCSRVALVVFRARQTEFITWRTVGALSVQVWYWKRHRNSEWLARERRDFVFGQLVSSRSEEALSSEKRKKVKSHGTLYLNCWSHQEADKFVKNSLKLCSSHHLILLR